MARVVVYRGSQKGFSVISCKASMSMSFFPCLLGLSFKSLMSLYVSCLCRQSGRLWIKNVVARDSSKYRMEVAQPDSKGPQRSQPQNLHTWSVKLLGNLYHEFYMQFFMHYGFSALVQLTCWIISLFLFCFVCEVTSSCAEEKSLFLNSGSTLGGASGTVGGTLGSNLSQMGAKQIP